MIFITVGTQKFQFNRLLEEVDKLVEEGLIIEDIFAQIGYSSYRPRNYKYKDFLSRDEFDQIMDRITTVITHGGTGSIITAVKKNKRVIAVPRLSRYGEHVDDHQLQIVKQFKDMEFIEKIDDIKDLKDTLCKLKNIEFKKYISNTETIILDIDNFINSR